MVGADDGSTLEVGQKQRQALVRGKPTGAASTMSASSSALPTGSSALPTGSSAQPTSSSTQPTGSSVLPSEAEEGSRGEADTGGYEGKQDHVDLSAASPISATAPARPTTQQLISAPASNAAPAVALLAPDPLQLSALELLSLSLEGVALKSQAQLRRADPLVSASFRHKWQLTRDATTDARAEAVTGDHGRAMARHKWQFSREGETGGAQAAGVGGEGQRQAEGGPDSSRVVGNQHSIRQTWQFSRGGPTGGATGRGMSDGVAGRGTSGGAQQAGMRWQLSRRSAHHM